MASRDGSFELEFSEGSAVLTVHPPGEGGKPVYSDDVLNRMRILGIPRVPLRRIQQIVDKASQEPVKLIKWPAGADLSAALTIDIAEDGSVATCTMSRPRKGGGIPAGHEVEELLAARGVVHGIDAERIEMLVSKPVFDKPVEVAVWTPPVHGKPSTVEYTFETDVGKPYLVDDSGRINLRELNFIQNKHTGDVLARIHPPVEPVDGTDVFGESIPAEPAGYSTPVKPGNNTDYGNDDNTIVAQIDGNAFVQGKAIHVEPVVVVDQVDYKNGNIDFEGSVVVRRSIADGFTVKAGGMLEIGECIGRVELYAGRTLVLKGGINGGGEGTARCDGDILAKFVEGANVQCGGSLIVEDAVMHSALTVYGGVGLKGRHAEILGGTAAIGGSLWCKQAGSVSETTTRISIGVEPDRLLELAKLKQRLAKLRDRLDDLDRIYHHLERKTNEGIDQSSTMEKIGAEGTNNRKELADVEQRLKELKKELTPDPSRKVVVEEIIYPQTVISFGREEFRAPSRGARKTILSYRDGRIIESGFNTADPPDFTELIPTGVE